jgi:hypothetical protein
MNRSIRPLAVFISLCVLVACTNTSSHSNAAKDACPVTKAAWLKPPADSAVQNEPGFGYYFVNEDQSIWASAWWVESNEYSLQAGDEGNKLGWFRPAGAELMITGQRLDAEAPPLDVDVPAGYLTRFQATGIYFTTEGCWEGNVKAEDKEVSFVVWVEP